MLAAEEGSVTNMACSGRDVALAESWEEGCHETHEPKRKLHRKPKSNLSETLGSRQSVLLETFSVFQRLFYSWLPEL